MQQSAFGNPPLPARCYLACPVMVGALSPDFSMQMGPILFMNRRIPAIPASKRRRVYEATSTTGFVRSLRDMFERPAPPGNGAVASDSEQSDAQLDKRADDKKGTSMYHIARAVDKMLMHAGLGGLKTWIDDNPQSRIPSTDTKLKT